MIDHTTVLIKDFYYFSTSMILLFYWGHKYYEAIKQKCHKCRSLTSIRVTEKRNLKLETVNGDTLRANMEIVNFYLHLLTRYRWFKKPVTNMADLPTMLFILFCDLPVHKMKLPKYPFMWWSTYSLAQLLTYVLKLRSSNFRNVKKTSSQDEVFT
jgi:hypothetical protein